MQSKTIVTTLFAAALTAIAMTTTVRADDCVSQYGGSQYGTDCAPTDLVINKEVQKIGASPSAEVMYVENLSVNDASPSAGTHLSFRLSIENRSGRTFESVEVKDIFPPYLSYVVGGPSGTVYDAQTRTMVATLKNMIAGEKRTLYLTAKVDEASSFPAGKTSFCVVNTAQVRADGRFDEDTAQVCLNNIKKGTSTLPKAGFTTLSAILPFLGLGAVGMYLTKRNHA